MALAKSAEEAAADMERYRENLEVAAETAPFKDSLPKGSAGKISRRELAAPFWAGRDRRIS